MSERTWVGNLMNFRFLGKHQETIKEGAITLPKTQQLNKGEKLVRVHSNISKLNNFAVGMFYETRCAILF